MKRVKYITMWIAGVIMAGILGACHDVGEYEDGPRGNFEQLWKILDEHYCFFEEKGVDWNEVHARYGAMIRENMTREELFDVCARMLDELKDGHTNLSAPFDVSYYKKWWSDYPQNYDARLVEEHYFNFNERTVGGVQYGILTENVGYMHYSSFSYGIGEGNMDAILSYMMSASGLIIDVRDNGGGTVTNIETIVGRFITSTMYGGSIRHKTGPGHGEFSEPYPIYYQPAEEGRIMWGKPVVVLCNRSTFSAANQFVAVMKYVDNVTIVGATTGGGSGMPFSSELSNGWGVRFSGSPITDPKGEICEFGVEPSEGCAVDMDPQAALEGRDTMLDFAINLLQK